MAILKNPITLPASKMLAAMTTLIADIRFINTIETSPIMNRLVASCEQGNVDFGKGIVFNFKLDYQPVKTLTENSSAFTITKPAVGQETLVIDEYNFIPISSSEVLSRDAVLNGNQVSTFFAFIMSLLNETHDYYLFNKVVDMYNSWVPGQASQTIEIPVTPLTGLSGADLESTKRMNATIIAEEMRKVLNNMQVPSSKFSDVATYINPNTGEATPVKTCLSSDNLKIVWNDQYYTEFLGNAMASLYHSDQVGNMLPGSEMLILPTDVISENNATTIAWLSDRTKFAIATFYSLAMSIVDPSTTYTNIFFHFALGGGVLDYPVGVKFVAVEKA